MKPQLGQSSLTKGGLKRKNHVHRTVGFVVFDSHMNLLRLPPDKPYDKNYPNKCNVILYNNHTLGFKNHLQARDRMNGCR